MTGSPHRLDVPILRAVTVFETALLFGILWRLESLRVAIIALTLVALIVGAAVAAERVECDERRRQ